VVVVLASLQEGVDRNGDGADSDRAEEGGHPAGGVIADQEHALFASDAEVEEGPGRAVGELEEVGVGEVTGGGVDGDLGGAGGEVALEEVGANVVAVGEFHLSNLCT
jgi:hypothetical protein